jgi:hypothetical protein
MKNGHGEPVTIHISTQSAKDYEDNMVLYNLWSFVEEWEIRPFRLFWGYPSVCWKEYKSRDLLLGSGVNTVSGSTIDNILEINPSDRKLSEIYRITVKQNAISKQAYDYLTNIKKNAKQTGSIFSPIPLEIAGNITCTTDPGIPVIGYVDVSTTTKKQLYISHIDHLYEPPQLGWDCQLLTRQELYELFNVEVPERAPEFMVFQPAIGTSPELWVKKYCVECDGTAQKPNDWPN